MAWLLVVGVGLLLLMSLTGFYAHKVIRFWVASSEYLRCLFAAEHCCELIQAAIQARLAAVERVIEGDVNDIQGADEPRRVFTSTGLALVYTVEKVPEAFVHYYSISLPGVGLTNPTEQTLLLLISKVMGVSLDALELYISDHGVYHARFVLPENQHEESLNHKEFLQRLVIVPFLDRVEELRRKCFAIRPTLNWKYFSRGSLLQNADVTAVKV